MASVGINSVLSDGARIRRLRRLLVLFFILLMLPVGALLYFGFQQMKWEVYHQYREQAEALVGRINSQLTRLIERENLRPSTDYRYVSTQVLNGEFELSPSPLSKLPESLGITGLVGYFQIDQHGVFTTPLIPSADIGSTDYRLSAEQLAIRNAISVEIRNILVTDSAMDADDQQRYSRSPSEIRQSGDQTQLNDLAAAEAHAEVAEETASPVHGSENTNVRLRKDSIAQFDVQSKKSYQPNRQRLGSVAELELDDSFAQKAEQGLAADTVTDTDKQNKFSTTPSFRRKEKVTSYAAPNAVARSEQPNQDREQLERSIVSRAAGAASLARTEPDVEKLDESTMHTFDAVEGSGAQVNGELASKPSNLTATDKGISQPLPPLAKSPVSPTPSEQIPRTISTFETEVENLRLSIFDDQHLVMHRTVWQNGSRFIQGLVIRRDEFIKHYVQSAFYTTPLATMSQLVVALNDDVLNIFTAPNKYRYSYSSASNALKGTVLFQRNLVAPMGEFSLIFNITELPLGKSVKYLAWVTMIMLAVMLAGFTIIYRYSKRQISLIRQQQDFVSAVSHELKTPLTSIRMYSEMLKNGWANEEKRQGYYEYIHGESERLSRLIENVLQLARINRKQTELSIAAVGVDELLSNALSTISSLAQNANFEIEENFEQSALNSVLQTSSDAAMQIIINIVDNAIKFSHNAKIKKVCVRTNLLNDGSLEIGIRDFGPGIAQSQLKKIFELFYRSENELTRETVGTGIGLALVHELATNLGITIDIRHCDPGVEFTINWPTSSVRRKGERE